MRSAFFAFALTRGLIFLVVIFTAQLVITPPTDPTSSSAADLSIRKIAFARIIRKRVSVGDANWYMGIAANGYTRRPFATDQHYNWAFFPLFPLTLRVASWLTGESALTGVALSSVFFFASLILLHKTALAFGFEASDASRATLYLAAFPLSYFFSLPLTESLFLLLTVGSFYAAKRELWWAAGILGALASATRITGVLLLPALAILYWETYRNLRPRANFVFLFLIPAGLLSFMWFLYSITGNALAFMDISIAWGRKPAFFLVPLLTYLRDPLHLANSWDLRLVNFLAAITVVICGFILLKWRRWSLAFYALASIFVTLSSGVLQSQGRYSMVVFPAFMVLAIAGRRPRIHQTIVTVSLIMLTLFTILFCKYIDIVLS